MATTDFNRSEESLRQLNVRPKLIKKNIRKKKPVQALMGKSENCVLQGISFTRVLK